MDENVIKVLYVEDDEERLEDILNALENVKEKYETEGRDLHGIREFDGILISTKDDEANVYKKIEEGFNIVLMDQRMPVRGSEILTYIKEKYPVVVSFVLSAYAVFEDDIEPSIKAGIFDYIRKQDIDNNTERLMDRLFEGATEYKRRREKIAYVESLEKRVTTYLRHFAAGVAHHFNNDASKIKSALQGMVYKKADGKEEGIFIDLKKYIALLSEFYSVMEQENCQIKELDEIVSKIRKIDLGSEIESLDESLRWTIQALSEATEHITSIVKDLRVYSQLDKLDFEEIWVYEGLDKSISLAEEELNNSKVNVIKNYSHGISVAKLNPATMNVVYSKIITNACEFEAKNLTVSAEYDKELEKIRIIFEDDGRGIAKEDINDVFTPFYTTKGKTSATKDGKDTGLSMFVAKTLVEDINKGRLYCESEQGKYTRFIIELPVKRQ